MSSTSAEIMVTKSQVLSTGYATIAIATVFTAVRFFLRCTHRVGQFQIEDGFCVLSWVAFVTMVILYTIVAPPLYRVDNAISTGDLYATVDKDAKFITEIFFANTMIFWIVLWSVKMSLLFLYRRLFEGLPDQMRWWWGVLVFTLLMFIGCVVSNFTSCQSMHAWFTPGLCDTHKDEVAEVISLYFAFAVDVLTDIMIMLLPWKLIWLLRLPRQEKLALGAVFCVGLVCVAMAIVRTVQVGLESRSDTTPSSTWLMFWGEIEGVIAVVVGTLPAFAIFFRRQQHTRRYGSYPSYPTPGGSKNRSNPSRGIPLTDRSDSDRPIYNHSKTMKLNGISVTRTLDVSRSTHTNDTDMYPLHDSYAI